MSFPRPRVRPAFIVAAALSGGLGFLAVAANGDEPSSDSALASAVPEGLMQAFPSFASPRTADDVLPADAERLLARQAGLELSESRRTLSSPTQSLYVVPGSRELCVVNVDDLGTGASCTLQELAADPATPPITIQIVAGGTRVFGLLPGIVRDVTLIRDGRPEPIHLENNAFSVDVPGGTGLLRWTTAEGETHEFNTTLPRFPAG